MNSQSTVSECIDTADGVSPPLQSVAPGASAPEPLEQPMRVAVVTPIPTPYRDPFWNEFARRPGVELTVFYCSPGKSDRPWAADWQKDYKSEVLRGWNLLKWRGPDASCYWNPTLRRRLTEGRFDAVLIGGYNHPTMWVALLLAYWRKIPYFLMCESHLRSQRAGWKQRLKRPVLRWIVKHAAGCLPTGRLSSEFLRSYGADARSLTLLPNVPDVVHVEAQAQRLRRAKDFPGPPRSADRPVVLFVGRLIAKKRAELVIRAFGKIARENDAALVIVGDGPLRSELEKLVDELDLREHVWFAGFVQPAEVVRWYARASLFVLPSSETWGVAVVEALAAGLPVVVADEVGCHPDLVADPALGAVVPARDELALSDAMRMQLSRNTDRTGRRAAWQELQSRLRYDVLAKELERVLRGSVGRAPVTRLERN